MDVSVVIPLYNGEAWIEETITSVLSQRHRPREVIVVDDGSTDASPRIAQSYADVTLVENEGNGTGSARDFGFQHTSAPLIAFLDQDDVWHSSHLALLSRLLENNTYPAAAANIDRFESSSTPRYNVAQDDVQPEDPLQADDVHELSPWDRFPLGSLRTPSSVVVRRSALKAIGGWPTQFTVTDINAWFKLTTDRPMLKVDKATTGKRVHGASLLQTLRTEEVLSYFQEHVRACAEALAFRGTVRSDDPNPYQERLDVLKAVGDVLRGGVYGDQSLLASAISTLEETSIEADMEENIASFAMWVFRNDLPDTPEKQREFLTRIVQRSPNRCSHAQSLIHKMLAQSPLPSRSFVMSASSNLHRMNAWFLLYEVLKTRVGRRTGIMG